MAKSVVAEFEQEIEAEKAFDPTEIKGAKAPADPIPFEEEKTEGANDLDYGPAAKLIEAIEKEQAEIDAINADAMDKKAPHRDEIASLRKKVRDDHSIEAKALSLILTKRRQLRRLEEREAALEETAAHQFEQLEMVL